MARHIPSVCYGLFDDGNLTLTFQTLLHSSDLRLKSASATLATPK